MSYKEADLYALIEGKPQSGLWWKFPPTPHDEREGQNKEGRLWDILWMARLAAKANKDNSDTVLFKVLVQCDQKQQTITLKMVLNAEALDGGPCLTIMRPDED